MAAGVIKTVAGTTTADRDFLPFHNFWIVLAAFGVKRPSDWLKLINSSETIPYVPLGCST